MTEKYLPEIWVCCETRNKELTSGAKELLGKAQQMGKEAGYKTAAILFAGAERETAAFGAEKIYRFPVCREEEQAKAIALLAEEGRPWAILFSASARGRMVAAMLSVQLKTGLTADCVQLSIEDGFLRQTRSAFGGSLMADIFCRHSYPQMATVQRGIFPIPEKKLHEKTEIIKCRLAKKPLTALKLLRRNEEMQEGVSLSEAKIVLSGGMGLATKKNFVLLQRAAEKIGAVPAASRAAVNAGLAPYAWQIGQSGKIIRPTLYIACGISGAVQHLAGVQGAGCIAAINSDKKAPIFHHADIGILEDAVMFLEKLLEME